MSSKHNFISLGTPRNDLWGLGRCGLRLRLGQHITFRLEVSRVQSFDSRSLQHGIEHYSIVSGLEWQAQARGCDSLIKCLPRTCKALGVILQLWVGGGEEETQTNNFETQGKWLRINDEIQKY